MLTQSNTRFAVVICLVLIVILLAFNLKNNYMGTFLNTSLLDVKKETGAPVVMNQADQEKTKRKDAEADVVKTDIDTEEAYNKDLTVIRRKGLVSNIKDVDFTKLSQDDLTLTMHSYTDNIDVRCRRKLRMGNIGDGGWEICDDPDVRPRQPCIIYSFGINNDFSFDDDASKVYGCDVYCFDPSMTNYKDVVERSKLVHFYKIGLSDKLANLSTGWKLNTLGGIRAMLGHQNKTIDVLKMDIESAEWESVPEMIKSGQLLNVRQLMVEYHVVGDAHDYMLPRLQAIQGIERAGFKRYYVHKNYACGRNVKGFPIIRTSCYEVHYIKR